MRPLRILPGLCALLLAGTGAVLMAQSPPGPPSPVVWTVAAPAKTDPVAPGGRVEIAVRATIEPGWYIYATTQPAGGPTPLRITVPEGQAFTAAGAITGPEPKRAWDSAFEIDSAKHDGTATFTVPLRVDGKASAGPATLDVLVRYQACSETLCLRPKTETLSLPLAIGAARQPHSIR